MNKGCKEFTPSGFDAVEKSQMNKGKIPGLSVVIVVGDETIYQKGFEYSNIRTKEPVTSKTLFEIGSNSKALQLLEFLI